MYEAIILAGGLGTRLRSVVNEVPKVMAPVAGKPFLHYIIKKLIDEEVSRIILAVGYKQELIKDFISQSDYKAEFIFSIEEEALGTGGGIKLALEMSTDPNIFIINGDSFFDCSLEVLMIDHVRNDADISLALKPMKEFERYGTVELQENRITRFNEKKYCKEGLINAGVYITKNNIFRGLDLPKIFSMEKEIFETRTANLKIMGFPFPDYFIDIGIPEDFEKAQKDFLL